MTFLSLLVLKLYPKIIAPLFSKYDIHPYKEVKPYRRYQVPSKYSTKFFNSLITIGGFELLQDYYELK